MCFLFLNVTLLYWEEYRFWKYWTYLQVVVSKYSVVYKKSAQSFLEMDVIFVVFVEKNSKNIAKKLDINVIETKTTCVSINDEP